MDIRSYFKKSSSDTGNEADDFVKSHKKSTQKRSKRKGVLFDDSSDEDSPVKSAKTKKIKEHIIDVIDNSDEEIRKPKSKRLGKSKATTKILETTTPSQFFGKFNSPAKSKATKRKATEDVTTTGNLPKTPKKEPVRAQNDDLDDLLNELPLTPVKVNGTKDTVSGKLARVAKKTHSKVSPTKIKKEQVDKKKHHNETKTAMHKNIRQEHIERKPTTAKTPKTESSKQSSNTKVEKEKATNGTSVKKEMQQTGVQKTPKKAPSVSDADQQQSSAKKERFMKYQQWQNRSGPSAPGSKEIPKGADYCFEGLTFVITGIQESLTREEIQSLVERYGGKVTSAVSGRTSYLITGEDAGQSKLAKAEKHKTKVIDEDEFLNLIKTLPGKKSKYEVHETPKVSPPSKKLSPKKLSNGPSLGNASVPLQKVKKEVKLVNKESSQNPGDYMMWVDKYKPKSVKQIIGQQGASSNVQKLLKWLQNWHSNNRTAASKNKPKPKFSPWGGGDPTGSIYKAALLSGPPGVGKTTSATLVCKELGLSYVELNASDTRSKRTLKEEVAASVQNTSIATLFGQEQNVPASNSETQHVLIMDEVDGMAGNEDRGGMQELIQIIKSTKIPIICMCNDRASQKMRSLTNHCFDLRFQRPRVEQITGAVMSICYKEGMKVQAPAVQAIIKGCNQDVRQVLHNMNMIKSNNNSLNYDDAKAHADKSQKDVNLGIFDIARKLLSSESASLSLIDKSNLFFMDYSMIPKFIQENYPHVNPYSAKGNLKQHLNLLSKTADSIAFSDLIETSIRHDQSWSMLPMMGLMSTVIPSDFMRGGMQGMINFPSFFGKLSTTGKNRRLLQELKFHSSLPTCGISEGAFNLDLLPYMRWHLCQPLMKQSKTGENEVPGVTKLLSDYDFVREDFDSLMEVGQYDGQPNYLNKVDSKVKSAFTRTFNKESHMIPYAVLSAAAMKKKRKTGDEGLDLGEEGEQDVEDSGDDDKLDNDGMIKAKKKSAAKPKTTKKSTSENAGTSKRGKGKKK
uniref:Replication factor C subunit 1 n=1 Tax=Phallusia mammillata TaxID=59560 RepID=A0A6F9DQ16_9ASCI|nr:replication factor C subunit 1-like [Phallusia mammillata]